jgi:hypothetical protein
MSLPPDEERLLSPTSWKIKNGRVAFIALLRGITVTALVTVPANNDSAKHQQ